MAPTRHTKTSFHDGATRELSDDWKEPTEALNDDLQWAGITTIIAGPDQTTTPKVDNATEDFWMEGGHTWKGGPCAATV